MRQIAWIAMIAVLAPALVTAGGSPCYRQLRADMDDALAEVEAYLAAARALRDELQESGDKLQFMTASPDSTEIYITGANLNIVNGEDDTATTNGKGNLIIGYAEGGGVRSGSHNLAVGRGQDWQSYGGIVGGEDNAILAPFASALGGFGNRVSVSHGVVVGGRGNEVSGQYGVVCGGRGNLASGLAATICGGEENRASGDYSVVEGGYQREASGPHDWAAGSLTQDH